MSEPFRLPPFSEVSKGWRSFYAGKVENVPPMGTIVTEDGSGYIRRATWEDTPIGVCAGQGVTVGKPDDWEVCVRPFKDWEQARWDEIVRVNAAKQAEGAK